MIQREMMMDREGFTLIEVVIAMVILAIGLLGLQALGIGTARAISLGQIQSEYAIAASSLLEDAEREVRDNLQTINRTDPDAECGERRCATQVVANQTPVGASCLYDITVTVQPTAEQNLPWQTIGYTLQSELFIPGTC